jgi:hypothetical protein
MALLGSGYWLNMHIVMTQLDDNPDNSSTFGLMILYGYIHLMYILTNIFLILTAVTDPGIVLSSYMTLDDEEAPGKPDLDYCDVCELTQPPNTSHCYDCNVCIQELDHHCPWMGKCIGRKNMRWFMLFNFCWVTYMIELLCVVFIY